MNGIAVLTDLHIGKDNDSALFADAFLEFVTFFVKNVPKDVRTLVINGDTTQNYAVTPRTSATFRKFAGLIRDRFDHVIFNVGNHDIKGRSVTTESSIDSLTSFGETRILGNDTKISITTTVTEFIKPFEFIVYPYNTFTQKTLDVSMLEPVYAFTHQDNSSKLQADGITILNGHVHQRGKLGNVYNLGVGYQLGSEQSVEHLGFHIAWEDGRLEHIHYPQSPMFIRVAINNNRIDNEHAVKWISANRDALKKAHSIVVKVDHDTSKANLEKFKGVLSTINSNFEIIDEVKFVIDIDESTETRNFIVVQKEILSVDTHEKLQEIHTEATQ